MLVFAKMDNFRDRHFAPEPFQPQDLFVQVRDRFFDKKLRFARRDEAVDRRA